MNLGKYLVMDKSLVIEKNSELASEDTSEQTYGCRHHNSNHCRNNNMKNICAFVREDNICKVPSGSWKKQFEDLKNRS